MTYRSEAQRDGCWSSEASGEKGKKKRFRGLSHFLLMKPSRLYLSRWVPFRVLELLPSVEMILISPDTVRRSKRLSFPAWTEGVWMRDGGGMDWDREIEEG